MNIPSWDSYFISIANIVKTRSPDKTKVGCVLVSEDNRIISTGYNSVPSGINNIDWTDRNFVNLTVIHAELNCILYSESKFKNVKLYSTMSPCLQCIKIIAASHIKHVFYQTDYKDIEKVIDLCKFFNISLTRINI